MVYKDAKVYSDGSHYIAIPYYPKPKRRKTLKDTNTQKGDNGYEEVNLKEIFEQTYHESQK